MREARLKLGMTAAQVVTVLAEKDRDAEQACIAVMSAGLRVSSDFGPGGLHWLLLLDTFGIYGARLAALWQRCQRDGEKLAACLLACQFGWAGVSERLLNLVIDDVSDTALDLDRILAVARRRGSEDGLPPREIQALPRDLVWASLVRIRLTSPHGLHPGASPEEQQRCESQLLPEAIRVWQSLAVGMQAIERLTQPTDACDVRRLLDTDAKQFRAEMRVAKREFDRGVAELWVKYQPELHGQRNDPDCWKFEWRMLEERCSIPAENVP